MSSITHQDLLSEILAFCEVAGMSKASFGKQVFGDPRFVYDLEAGRQCLPRTVAKARGFMAGQSAAGAA